MSLSFPVSGWCPEEQWDGAEHRRAGRAALRLSHRLDGVFVGVQEIPETEWRYWAKVEFNPSRIADPDGWGLPTHAVAERAIESAWDTAREMVAPECALEDARVKRLDAARDFRCSSPEFFIDGLRGIHRPYAKRAFTYNDPHRNGAQTFTVGSGSGVARLYRKDVESAGLAPQGTTRWEVEARSRWLARAGIKRVSDISHDKVLALASERFDWSAMGAEIGAASLVVEKVNRADLTPAVKRALLGHLMMTAAGYPDELSRESAAKYRRLQRELGIVLAPGVFDGTFVARLDWDSGSEVIRAA